jgi:hypothetical protein
MDPRSLINSPKHNNNGSAPSKGHANSIDKRQGEEVDKILITEEEEQ